MKNYADFLTFMQVYAVAKSGAITREEGIDLLRTALVNLSGPAHPTPILDVASRLVADYASPTPPCRLGTLLGIPKPPPPAKKPVGRPRKAT